MFNKRQHVYIRLSQCGVKTCQRQIRDFLLTINISVKHATCGILEDSLAWVTDLTFSLSGPRTKVGLQVQQTSI